MKYKYIIPVIALAAMSLIACDDSKMEWYKDPSHGEITESELPLQLAEKISRYAALKTYATDFTLGIGVGLDEYINNEAYRALVDENFHEITIGYAMKHGPMVKSDGSLDFTNVDKLFQQLQISGLGLYGHTLVWHQNQNASYLNGLIAATVIPGSDGDNLISNGSFEDGLTGWVVPYYASNVTAVADEAIDETQSMKVVVGSFGGSKYNMQINSPGFAIVKDHRYEISFFIKSDVAGSVGLSFPNANLKNQYPMTNGSGTVATSSTWTKVTYNPTTTPDGMVATTDASAMTFTLLLGEFNNVTYYVDAVTVIDLDAQPYNYITNSDFETGSISPWTGWGGTSTRSISENGEGFGDTGYALKLVNPTAASNYSSQAKIDLKDADGTIVSLENGKKYKASLWIKSSVSDGSVQFQLQPNGGGQYSGDRAVGVAWTQLEWEFTSDGDDTAFFIDFGLKAATYYVDNVVLQEVTEDSGSGSGSGTVIVEKTDEEKAELIGGALESWISQMVSHCKGVVKAWDVVNEPMDDGKPSSLKTGVGKTDMASDEFYWQDYLGKDYAVTAFKLARQYGNADDKLFINDYNLEYNLAKCDGLIAYVDYIETQGVKVDGIGTQMHISITSNKDNIAQMFQKLAATGKLIKISELDITVGTASPTTDQFAQQAEMYQYVIDMYKQYIPAAQQFAITIWGLSDDPKEHVNWLPDDAPNLWDANYNRKHAYKGAADGLAGKDVSEDFTGELQ